MGDGFRLSVSGCRFPVDRVRGWVVDAWEQSPIENPPIENPQSLIL